MSSWKSHMESPRGFDGELGACRGWKAMRSFGGGKWLCFRAQKLILAECEGWTNSGVSKSKL